MKLFGFTTEAHHGKHKQKNENKQKSGNSDDPQISRPDLRFASRKTANNTKRVLGPQGLKAMEIGAKQYDKEAKKGPLDLKTRALKMNL